MPLFLEKLSYHNNLLKCISSFFLLQISASVIYAQGPMEPTSTTKVDSIHILTIYHSQPSEADHSRTIQVDVKYKLVSKSRGKLMIGLDLGETGRFRMLGEIEQIVEQSTGRHTFQTTLTEEQWNGDKPFSVYVNLSEYPHPSRWTPLANDREVLLLTP